MGLGLQSNHLTMSLCPGEITHSSLSPSLHTIHSMHASISRYAQTSCSIAQEEEARKVFQQLLLALDYCHGMGFSNKDIMLENVLLTSRIRPAVIKLTNVGTTKRVIRDHFVGISIYTGMQLLQLERILNMQATMLPVAPHLTHSPCTKSCSRQLPSKASYVFICVQHRRYWDLGHRMMPSWRTSGASG